MPQLSSLKVRVIQARGNPVTVRSPRQGIYARCHGIDYAPGLAGAAGSFLAIGPGIMQRNLPDDPSGKIRRRVGARVPIRARRTATRRHAARRGDAARSRRWAR